MRRGYVLVALLMTLMTTTGCASIASAMVGACGMAALQVGAEICVGACSAAICDGPSGTIVSVDDVPPNEVPPPPPTVAEVTATEPPPPLSEVACRRRQLPGGTWRVDCADGAWAEALGEGSPAAELGDGDVMVHDLGAIIALAERRSVLGSLRLSGHDLLRVSLPSLRHVQGALTIENTALLREVQLSNMKTVGRGLVITNNRALRRDIAPSLERTGFVDVRDNDALPVIVVDRLLALGPPPL